MYEILTSTRDADDLSIGLDRDRNKKQRELANNKNIKRKCSLGTSLKVIFGFADYQEKLLSDSVTNYHLQKNTDNGILKKDNAANIGIFKTKALEWCVPHYSPSVSNQDILSKQTLNETPTELQYVENCFYERSEYSNFLDFWIGNLRRY